MKANDISQLPVSQGDEMIGSITESKILEHILNNPLKMLTRRQEIFWIRHFQLFLLTCL